MIGSGDFVAGQLEESAGMVIALQHLVLSH